MKVKFRVAWNAIFTFIGLLFLVINLKGFVISHSFFGFVMTAVWGIITYFNVKALRASLD